MTPILRTVETASGIRLSYAEHGEPTGVPVVLLHGLTDSLHSYDPVLPYLPPAVRAFAVTARGHGASSQPGAGYGTADFAADVAGFLDALDVPSAFIVGHSMGATHALRFALDHPERTRGLVLIGAFARFEGNPAIDELCAEVVQLADPVDAAFARAFQESTLACPIDPGFLARMADGSARTPARVWRAALAGLRADDVLPDLHRIRAPARILWGSRDAFCPRGDQDLLCSSIPRAELRVHAGFGHALHWEHPRGVAADLVGFVLDSSRDATAPDAPASVSESQPESNRRRPAAAVG